MAAGNQAKWGVIDQNGKRCDQSFHVASTVHDPDGTEMAAIYDAFDNLIEGGVFAGMITVDDDAQVAGTGVPGGYNAADKIHMVCRSTGDGSTVIIDIPSPGVTDSVPTPIFNADGTVNQSCAAVSAAITFINAHVLDTNGNAVVWVSGKRTRSDRLRTAF
jgi:hypothetical protein